MSNNDIIKLKNNKEKDDIEQDALKLNNKIKIKFIFYFIIGFILLLFFWYYLSMFSVIYRNTQIILIEDTLLSFGFGLLIPFVIYLFPGLFRIPALSNKNRYYMYKISEIIQEF